MIWCESPQEFGELDTRGDGESDDEGAAEGEEGKAGKDDDERPEGLRTPAGGGLGAGGCGNDTGAIVEVDTARPAAPFCSSGDMRTQRPTCAPPLQGRSGRDDERPPRAGCPTRFVAEDSGGRMVAPPR